MFGLEQVHFSWQGASLMENFSLNFPLTQTTALLGASGIGKSTLLRLLAGLVSPQRGKIHSERSQIAWMGQQDQLYPWLSAIDNVLLPAKLNGVKADYTRAKQLLAAVGLEQISTHKPDQLSGGMRQRVALARTLYADRQYVLMDEPFAMLDVVTKLKLQNLAAQLLADKTVVIVTHDPLEACRLADNILLLHNTPLAALQVDVPPGDIPRPADDASLLSVQAKLLHYLVGYETTSI